MDIRTWQDADRAADDPYRPRHRSGRSPFRPWRPGPVAVGSLSTAAVAAVAFAAPGVLHVRTAPVDTRLDGAPHHIGPLTPGPDQASDGTPTASTTQGDQPISPSSTAAPAAQTGSTDQGSDGGSTGAAGGTVKSAGTHGPTGQARTPVTHQPGGSTSASHPGSTGPGHSTGTAPGGNAPNNAGSSKNGGTTGTGGGSTGGPGGGGTTGGWGGTGPSGGASNPGTAPFDATAAVSSAITTIDGARAADHLGRLRVDGALTFAAVQHTSDMARNGTFSHTGTDGSDPYTRALRAGCFTFTKEIIARGNPGDDVVGSLLRDPSSYRALTSPGSHSIGIAAQQDPNSGQIVWTIELGWA